MDSIDLLIIYYIEYRQIISDSMHTIDRKAFFNLPKIQELYVIKALK